MRRTWMLLVLGVVVALALLWAIRQRDVVYSQSSPVVALADESSVSIRVRLGVTDTEPRSWDGTLSVSGGEVVGLRNWRPRPGDRIDGLKAWTLSTRRGPNYVARAWEPERMTSPLAYINEPGLIVDVKGPGVVLTFNTPKGSFDVRPASIRPAEPVSFLDGAVVVERVAGAHLISGRDQQNDFATLAVSDKGDMWAAWVAYADKRNTVMARRFDGSTWGGLTKVSDGHTDIFLVKAGHDRNGAVWMIWSAQVEGNWDLYGRRFDGRAWSSVERLTSDPQPDIYQEVVTDSSGNLWLVWQGFRNGKSDIFVRRYDGSAWSAAEAVSKSPANDWAPAIAADKAGRVYIAWDTYDRGDYDVMMSKLEGGRWSAPQPIAATPKFEAYVSLACDADNRLWAAWNESGTQWGKDTGFLVRKEATRLYQSRLVAVAVHDGGEWREPNADFEQSLPSSLQGYNDLPVLRSDSAGRMWLFFRHRFLRLRDVPSEAPAHRAAWEIYGVTYQGDRWSTPVAVPLSQGRTDMRAGFAADRSGNMYVAWPMDNRDYENFLFERADVYAARMPAPQAVSGAPKLRPRVPVKIQIWPAHPDEAEDLARIRKYQMESGGRTYKIYRGDTHRHTEFSHDGNNDGSLLDTYRYAIDAAELDFLMVSDHNSTGGPDIDYINWLLQQMVDVLTLPGRFVPMYGYERSVGYPNGHRNVIFARRGNPTLPVAAEEQKAKTGAQALYEYLKKYDGIAISHTSASSMGTDWRDNHPEFEPLVEIYQGARVSNEYEGAPKAAHAANPATAIGGFRPAGYVWNAWAKGYKLGVQASSDHLSTHISYACTLSPAFTREELLRAMKRRHSYGATDNIILDYRLQSGGREHLQGDIVTVGAGFRLVVKAVGTLPIRQIDIIKNNTFIHNRQPMQREVSFTFTDTEPVKPESYYYVRVIQVDDQIAWSSPIWVTKQ